MVRSGCGTNKMTKRFDLIVTIKMVNLYVNTIKVIQVEVGSVNFFNKN